MELPFEKVLMRTPKAVGASAVSEKVLSVWLQGTICLGG